MTERHIDEAPDAGKGSEAVAVHVPAAPTIKRIFTTAYENDIIDGAELARLIALYGLESA